MSVHLHRYYRSNRSSLLRSREEEIERGKRSLRALREALASSAEEKPPAKTERDDFSWPLLT